MNSKRAKALRQAINVISKATTRFRGPAANHEYLRDPYNGRRDPAFWGGPIRVDSRSIRGMYLRAKKNDNNRTQLNANA